MSAETVIRRGCGCTYDDETGLPIADCTEHAKKVELGPNWFELTCQKCGDAYATQHPEATEVPTCPSCLRKIEQAPQIEPDDPEIQRRKGRAVSATASQENEMGKTDVRSFFEKRYIGSWDLPDGRDVVVVIDRVEGGDVKGTSGESKRAPLVFFSNVKNRKKPLVLNATNAKAIIKMYGKFIEEWSGKPVTLYATKTVAFGEEVDCIRVRPEKPAMPKSAVPAELGDNGMEATA